MHAVRSSSGPTSCPASRGLSRRRQRRLVPAHACLPPAVRHSGKAGCPAPILVGRQISLSIKRHASALAASAARPGVSQHVALLALALVPLTTKDHAHRPPRFSVRISTLQPLYSKRWAWFRSTLIGVCILILASDRQCSFTLLSGVRRGTGRPWVRQAALPGESKENIVGAGLLTVCILEYIGKPFADGAQPCSFQRLKRAGAPLRLNSRRSLCLLPRQERKAMRNGRRQQCGCACPPLVNGGRTSLLAVGPGPEGHPCRFAGGFGYFMRRTLGLMAFGATAGQGQVEGRAPMNSAARGAAGSLGLRIRPGPALRSCQRMVTHAGRGRYGALATSPRPPRISS